MRPGRALPARSDAARRFEPANGDHFREEGRSKGFVLVFLLAAALGGAALPFTFGDMFPRSFTATAVLGVEKGDAVSAMAAQLKENASLDSMVALLDLKREPLMAGGEPGALAVATDLLAGTERTAAPPDAALNRRLAETLSIMQSRDAGQLSLAVTTPDAVLSVRLANAFADEGTSRAAQKALDDTYGVTAAREAAETAERALADFTAGHDAGDIEEQARLSAEIAMRDAAIAAQEAALANARQDSARIAALKPADIASGTARFDFEPPVFDVAREKYITAKLELDTLSAQLGPRHPRLLAAQTAMEDARGRLQDALRKLDASARERLRTITRSLDEARAERAALESPTEQGGGLEQMEALKREAERLRADYLDKLDISRAAPAPPPVARVLVPASDATVVANGPRPAIVALAGAALGLFMAAGWLFMTGRQVRDEQDEIFEEDDTAVYFDRDTAPRATFQRDEEEYGWQDDDEWGPPPAHNDDMPLAMRLRDMLRRSAEMDFRETMRAGGEDRQAELEEIRRRMMFLRQRVEAYNARRSGSR